MNIPVPNWQRRVDLDIACGLLGQDYRLAFINEGLEKVDPRGEEALKCAKKMYEEHKEGLCGQS